MFAKLLGWWRWHNEKRKERGQGLVEYALILVLVSIVVITMLSFLGTSINDIFQRVADALQGQHVSVLQAVYFPNADKIDIRAHYRNGYDANVTLTIAKDGGTAVPMARWDNWAAHPELTPTYGRSFENPTGCPCTFTITDPDGNTKTVIVSTD
jgi:pilus assembly protein Flp/PilA